MVMHGLANVDFKEVHSAAELGGALTNLGLGNM
jgi:hypothetical protein